MDSPKYTLTIVTIVRNHREGLLRTISSVSSQTFRDFEYIVVDGASTDGTLDVIESNKNVFSTVLYGPDKGIYDAMNKGVMAAKGKYTLFMNAGDVFASDEALAELFAGGTDTNIIYGDYTVNYGFSVRYVKANSLDSFWKGMVTSHQAIVVSTALMQNRPFDISVRIGADFDMLYSLYIAGATFRYVPVAVSIMEPGGLSDVRRMDVYRDHLKTVRKNGAGLLKQAYYLYIFADTRLRLTAKKILPQSLVRRIIGGETDR